MRTLSPKLLVLVLSVVVLAALLPACNRASPVANTASLTQIAAAADPALQAVVGTEPATVISLTVEGGPREGSYEVALEETSCSYGLMGEDSWGNQYSVLTDDLEAFSSLQLIVPSTAEAATGTSTFLTTISFGPFAGGGASYTIGGLGDGNFRGEGTVTIQDDDDAATVVILGETDDGVAINATIRCNEVFRVAGSSEPAGDTTSDTTSTVATLTIDGSTQSFEDDDEEASCGYGESHYGLYEGENGWYYGLYRETDEDLIMIEVFVPESGAATDTFYFTYEGGPDQHIIYNDADYASGMGTATVEDEGDILIIRVEGETEDGTSIDLTVRCEGVER